MSDAIAGVLDAAPPGDGKKGSGRKSGLVPTIAAVGGLTLVAVCGGAALGWMVGGKTPEPVPDQGHAPAAATPAPSEPVDQIAPLQAIVTNIASPSKAVARLQASIVFRKDQVADAALLAAQIEGDTLAFLKTVDMVQIEGARGLLHLKEDLAERAKIRSPAVSDYLIESLIIQ